LFEENDPKNEKLSELYKIKSKCLQSKGKYGKATSSKSYLILSKKQ